MSIEQRPMYEELKISKDYRQLSKNEPIYLADYFIDTSWDSTLRVSTMPSSYKKRQDETDIVKRYPSLVFYAKIQRTQKGNRILCIPKR